MVEPTGLSLKEDSLKSNSKTGKELKVDTNDADEVMTFKLSNNSEDNASRKEKGNSVDVRKTTENADEVMSFNNSDIYSFESKKK